MRNTFVNGLGFVNAQFIEQWSSDYLALTDPITKAKSPNLKDSIAPAMSRRMAAGVKMGIYASLKALKEANIERPEAIITGTHHGCLIDSEKFLTALIENEEEFLTPSAFIQSTHNTVASQIALHLQCKAYNFTYTNGYNSFENALLDGLLQIENEEIHTALIGGVEEIGERIYQLHQLIGEIENQQHQGEKSSEGAHFFALANEKNENSYATVKDVWLQNTYEESDLPTLISDFLAKHTMELTDSDAIISGIKALKAMEVFQELTIVEYKHWIGEYGTASAFGFALGCQLLKDQSLPTVFIENPIDSKVYKNVLLVNGFNGKDLSMVLLQAV